MTKNEYKKWYDQTHKGDLHYWVTKQYGRMKRDEKNKFSSELSFTRNQFNDWILSNYKEKILSLLQNYKDSNYNKNLCPSIDRIDDYRDYTFDNMQLLTWEENNDKGRASKKNKEQCGTMAKNYWSKPILQYDSNMNFIAKFASTREAGRILGYDNSGIARACRLHKLYKGYRWEYE